MSAVALISVVVPVYNEEGNIPLFIKRMREVFTDIGCAYEIIFVMDPSTDRTEEIILESRESDKGVKLLKMSRRFGQPVCTMAGIQYCTGDACVIIDVDLQDPPALIKTMVEKWRGGYHVVFAQRTSRKGETLIKRFVSFAGYWLIDKIADVKIPRNTGDFRLISRAVIDNLKKFKEHDAFLRGLVAYVGFKQLALPYDRDARFSGSGNYNRLFGSIKIGLNGVLGFSKYPLHLISIIGLILSGASIVLGLAYVCLKILTFMGFFSFEIWGDSFLAILILFMSGIQLFSLGVIGQYFARTYDEIKARPLFIVDQAVGFEGDGTDGAGR